LLTWPDEQSIRSTPAALRWRAISTASSGVMPPSTQSCAEIRTEIGKVLRPDLAHRVEDLDRDSAGRLTSEPPYSSVRWLVSGEMNDDSR
jgi:hypothetical protein